MSAFGKMSVFFLTRRRLLRMAAMQVVEKVDKTLGGA
jgi:hypothetical protein